MKRRVLYIISLVLLAAILTGCSQQKQEVFDVYGQQEPQKPAATAVVQVQLTPQNQGSIMDENPYEDMEWFTGDMEAAALSEEEADQREAEQYAASGQVQNTVYPYAGATPIPLDPIDMPTPTPKPELTFTYVEYASHSLGLTFQGPAGWEMDETQSQLCILSEPLSQMKDGQRCIITISAEPVNSNYSEKELKAHVKQRLDTINTSDFDSFSPSLTATRNMMGSKGVYANYKGTLASGVQVGGRILYCSFNNKLYGLEIVYPLGFKSSYENVYGKMRSSMSLIK